jgi:hypothetical protein
MKRPIRLLLLVCLLTLTVVGCLHGSSHASDYLVGIFGVPRGDWSMLRESGVNTILVRENEIDKVASTPVKKIYVLGVNPPEMKKGLDQADIERRMRIYRGQKDAYGYYLAGDLSCKNKATVDSLKRKLNIGERAMIGLSGKGKGIDCFSDYEVFFYHYPLMRRQTALSEMLKDQVATLKKADFNGFLFVQTHQQFWYKNAIDSAHASKDAYLYPDGQAVRMLIHYAVATGCKGYFLYDYEALSGESSEERVLGAAQAILETRVLYPALAKTRGAEFFQRGNDVYGTKVLTPDYDLIFAFSSDGRTNHHPSTQPVKADLRDLIGSSKYLTVYRYSPLGCVPAGDKIEVPQDHALILVGLKDKINLESLKLNAGELKTYVRLLEARAERLAGNLKGRGLSGVPTLKQSWSNPEEKAAALLASIDQLNELKRDAWSKNAGKMPIDGDILNDAQWGRGKAQQAKPGRDDSFNFYYH